MRSRYRTGSWLSIVSRQHYRRGRAHSTGRSALVTPERHRHRLEGGLCEPHCRTAVDGFAPYYGEHRRIR